MLFILHYSSGFWYDSRLRCDVADLYFKLYGRKRPHAVPIPELAMLRPSTSQVKTEKSDKVKKFPLCTFRSVNSIDFIVFLQFWIFAPKIWKNRLYTISNFSRFRSFWELVSIVS